MALTRQDYEQPDTMPSLTETWLEHMHRRIEYRFSRSEPRARAFVYLRGLLSSLNRKNGWQIAMQAGESRPDGMQRLLATAQWDENLVRDDLREFVVEYLYDGHNILVVTESGFIKKGEKSVGVHRQFCPTTQRVENSQIGLFLLYVDKQGNTAPIDRALFLPKAWAEDDVRRGWAGVPSDVDFATRPQLAMDMLERALAAHVPARGIVSDQPYGTDRHFRERLEQARVPYVLGILDGQPLPFSQGDRVVYAAPSMIASRLPPDSWLKIPSARDPHAKNSSPSWAWVPLCSGNDSFARWLLIRRTRGGPFRLRYYICFERRGTHPIELVRRAAMTDDAIGGFRSLQEKVGLDHYEVRLWRAWYRHITLAMAAVSCVTLSGLCRDAGRTSDGGPTPAPIRQWARHSLHGEDIVS
jgi:hypothetical protein